MAYVRGANPIWIFRDLQGNPLDDTYYISFLNNTFPYATQLVYRDSNGSVAWADPLELTAYGGLPPNVYFNDTLVYRLEVRNGPTQNDELIYVVENYIPDNSTVTPAPTESENQDNQISNPQFSVVNFLVAPGGTEPSITFSAAGSYDIAPGWKLVLTGAGTTTLTQKIYTGAQNSAPPYALQIANAGWTTATLTQRLSGNGGIWANKYASASILALSEDAIAHAISVIYHPSTGSEKTLATGTLSLSPYAVIQGVASIGASTNSDLNNVAYVNINIQLPGTGSLDVSNVQVVGLESSDLVQTFPVLPDETIERQVDHLFHYYNPQLFYKPIPSFLVGWDFPLNPAQLGATQAASAIGANKSKYVWDQTIIFQSANSGVGVTRGTAGELLLTAAATTQMAVIQYLPATQARKILNAPISVNVSAMTSVTAGVLGTVSLWYTTGSLPNILTTGSAPVSSSIVATIDSHGYPATFNGTWSEVPTVDGQKNTFTVATSSTTNFNDYMLTGWDLAGNAAANTAVYFAIVVGFSSVANTKTIGINSVSLNSGKIATRPAPQTQDEVLRECQYYYEQSYELGTAVATASAIGSIYAMAPLGYDATNTNMWCPDIYLQYKQQKRTIPTLTFYSFDGTLNNIQFTMKSGSVNVESSTNVPVSPDGGTKWTVTPSSSNATLFSTLGTGVGTQKGGFVIGGTGEILYHYTADARLGVV